ncbi:hypothetical protein Vafri_15033 [Volvox africanus]|nr:hypothetical protein Vafri_15033 [Volvox africanus]
MPPDRPISSTWSFAQRALACSKPRCRTVEQINVIAEMLSHLAIFEGVERDNLLAVAYFIESKHSEAGECVLSKGQPLEQWCLLLHGSALLTRYSTQRGSEQTTTSLGPSDSWSEAALLHSTHLRRSSVTVVAGPQGCFTLRLRYSDYDAMNDFRNPLQLLPPEGTQGPLSEITVAQRRAAAMALLCCFLRRLASARSPDERTPEEASELEPFLSSLPAYKAYPQELVACLAAACRSQSLPAGSLVYEHSTLADAHVTVLSGEVQLRKLGGQPGGEETEADSGSAAAAAPGTSASAVTPGAAGGAASGTGAGVRPAPPPGLPQDSPAEGSSGRLNIRARLRREREARKLMQKQLDEYVSRLDSDAASADGKGGSGGQAPIKDPVSASPIDWTRVFMQKAMRTVEPMWKALHPADKAPRRRPGAADGAFDIPLDGGEGPITEVAQLLGPAAAKAYYRGLRSQGYSDTESPSPSGSSGGGSGGGARPSDTSGAAAGSNSVREKWKRRMFMVDGPETDHERTLRSMAMRASRIIRERHARSRGRGGFDAEEVEEMYGQQFASLTRGSPVGELSTVMLHSAMRKESAVAGPGGCELLLVDWEAYQQGVLGARSAVLARAATFLSSLSKDRLNRLAELCLCLSVETATLLARQGNPLEHMVVVQDGEVTLLHEPSAALHTRIASVRGLAISGSRNGRTQLLPLLSTLNTSNLPLSAIASGGSGAGGTGGAAAASGGPTPSGGSFSSVQTSPVEITLQGLLLGEVGAGEIVGEALLGSRGGGGISSISSTAAAAAAAASGHSDPSQHGHGHGQGHGQGNVHGTATGTGTDLHPPLSSASPVLPIEGPKWPATVLATRASVLLVIPRSVLYMSDFDSIRSDLMRFSVERRAWLGRRVEAAYRAAAAPTTMPAVFATAAGASQSASAAAAALQSHPLLRRPVVQSSTGDGGGDGGSADATPRPSAPTTPHTGSFPRRAASSDVSGGSLHAANGGAGSGTESTSSSVHHPICRRRSVESLQRSTSPGHTAAVVVTAAATTSSATVTTTTVTALASPGSTAAVVAATTGSGHILTRPNSKWDFLDGPTSATGSVNAGGGPSTSVGTEISSSMLGPLAMATGSFTRGGGAGVSIMDSAGSITLPSGMTLTGSFTSGSALVGLGGGALPLRRPSSGNLRTLKDPAAAVTPISVSSFAAANGSVSGGVGLDVPSLSPAQQALLEVGLDPYFAGSDLPYNGNGGGGTAIERHGSASSAGVVLAQGTGNVGSGSSVTPLPALNQPSSTLAGTSSRGLTPLIVAAGGSNSGSPAASADFDAMRTAGLTTPFRSPNALMPTSHRINGSVGATGLPAASTLPSSVSLLDSAYGSTSGIALNPSTALAGLTGYPSAAATAAGATNGVRLARASYCGGMTGGRRRTDMDGNASGVALTPAAGHLTAPPPALTPRIPALQALDVLETAVAATASTPPSPGLYARSARSSYTGGMTPRIASVDSSWLQMGGRGAFPGGLRGRSVTRDSNGLTIDAGGGGGSGVAPNEVEMDEEAALARSLVPKNQAGLFMVRGGAASTPAKLPAARRIAGCF